MDPPFPSERRSGGYGAKLDATIYNGEPFSEEDDCETKLVSDLFLFLVEKEEVVREGDCGDIGIGIGGIFSTLCTTCCRKGSFVRGKLCGAAGRRETGEESFLFFPTGAGKGKGVEILYRLLPRITVEEKGNEKTLEERVERIPGRQLKRLLLQQ